jgi:hypothetical protein
MKHHFNFKRLGLLTWVMLMSPQVWADSIQIKVTYGEKVTTFLINLGKKDSSVSMSSSPGAKKKKELQPDDADFIMELIQKLPSKLEATPQCLRKRIEVTSEQLNGKKNFEASACLDAKTESAQDLVGIVDVLSSWI